MSENKPEVPSAEELISDFKNITHDFENTKKLPVENILTILKTVDIEKAAEEMIVWCAINVENFIDNHMTIFKLNLDINSNTMPHSKKLQDLYRSIPEESIHYTDLSKAKNIEDTKSLAKDESAIKKIIDCRKTLNETTDKIFAKMGECKQGLDILYERMIYYYEMIGLKEDGDPVLRELDGKVHVRKFEYEAFSVPVKIKTKVDGKEKVIKQIIPEGFTIWIEIEFFIKKKQTSIF